MSNVTQRSFAAGELSPSLYARTDLLKYTTGLRTCRNFVVQRHGGAANRSGTLFIGEVKDSTKPVRLIRFVFDDQLANTYVLEFGDFYLRFFQNSSRINVSGVAAWVDVTAYTLGQLVVQGGVNYYCIAAHTSAAATDQPGTGSNWATKWYALTGAIYEIPTPYAVADLPNLVFAQSGDVITLTHPSYAPRELKRFSSTNWTLTSPTFGPSIGPPGNLASTGGAVIAWANGVLYNVGDVRSQGGVNYICALGHNSATALNQPGTGTNWQSYWYASGSRTYVVTAVKEGTLEESLVSASLAAGANFPNRPSPIVLTWDPVAGAIYYNVYRSIDGSTFGYVTSSATTSVLVSDSAWTTTTSTATTGTTGFWTQALTQCRNALAAISATTKPSDGKFNVFFQISVSGPGSGYYTQARVRAYYSRDGEVRVDAGLVNSNFYGVGSTGTATYQDHGSITIPDNGYTTLTIDLVPEVYGGGGVAVFTATLDETHGGFDKIEWNKTVPGYTDDGSIAQNYALRPPTQAAVFGAAGKYPSSVGYFKQRQLFGNSNSEPERVWGSVIGSYKSFSKYSPVQASDTLSFQLSGEKVNAVRHIVDIGQLLILTAQGEFIAKGDINEIVRPDAINPTSLSSNGCARLRPLKLSTSVLYLQARASIVRDLRPITTQSYDGTDLTVFSTHLFRSFTVVDWDFALNPDSVAWVVRSDGTLLGLTYFREHEIYAWHRHDTDGTFENVCVVPEGAEDGVYFVVKRTVNGVTKRYIERLSTRTFAAIRDAHFVDCGLVIDGRNLGATTMTISGGVNWNEQETLTLTASAPFFAAGDAGANSIFLTAADGSEIEFKLEGFTSNVIMTGHVTKSVAADLRALPTLVWAKAIKTVTGLAHLEAKKVAVFADGYVVASPNNARGAPIVATVAGGQIVLDRTYKVIRVGLPYISDLETLDIDSPGGNTIKDKKMLLQRVILFVERSRGIWAGRPNTPTATDPLKGLQEFKARTSENYADPISLITDDFEINTQSEWNTNGRMLIRQVDPLPLSLLSISPVGAMAN
ncbi:MAG: hypothetical protein JWL97_2977 [Gemmatimonadales bacterium]|nr:hypothetical protein [Gemmatimonadales bacterium]